MKKHKNLNMTVKDLKRILRKLPNDMHVVIPVISEDDCNLVFGFRHVRTAGILFCKFNEKKLARVIALNASTPDSNIKLQTENYDGAVVCEKILF